MSNSGRSAAQAPKMRVYRLSHFAIKPKKDGNNQTVKIVYQVLNEHI